MKTDAVAIMRSKQFGSEIINKFTVNVTIMGINTKLILKIICCGKMKQIYRVNRFVGSIHDVQEADVMMIKRMNGK